MSMKKPKPPSAQANFKPYLYAETNFVRSSQPIFVLAVSEQLRRIPVIGCSGLDQREKVAKACGVALQHFERCQGEVKIWGTIDYYLFFYAPNRSVLIRPSGEVDETVVGMNPPKAELIGFETQEMP